MNETIARKKELLETLALMQGSKGNFTADETTAVVKELRKLGCLK